jgi:hypothetical protein
MNSTEWGRCKWRRERKYLDRREVRLAYDFSPAILIIRTIDNIFLVLVLTVEYKLSREKNKWLPWYAHQISQLNYSWSTDEIRRSILLLLQVTVIMGKPQASPYAKMQHCVVYIKKRIFINVIETSDLATMSVSVTVSLLADSCNSATCWMSSLTVFPVHIKLLW